MRGRPPNAPRKMAEVDDIEPTRQLDDEELAVWARWKEVVAATRRFLSTDPPLLTMIVDLELRKALCRATIKAEGPYQGKHRHPALTDGDNAQRDLMAILREMGLTPASQKNVRAEKRAKEADDLGEFIKG